MVKTLLKHLVYDYAIDIAFTNLIKNFIFYATKGVKVFVVLPNHEYFIEYRVPSSATLSYEWEDLGNEIYFVVKSDSPIQVVSYAPYNPVRSIQDNIARNRYSHKFEVFTI